MVPDTYTYAAMISAYKDCGQWARALEVVQEMKTAGAKLDAATYSALISTCERSNQWERAMEVRRNERDNHFKVWVGSLEPRRRCLL